MNALHIIVYDTCTPPFPWYCCHSKNILASPNRPVSFLIATVNALAKMVPSLSRNRLVETVLPALQQCIMRYFKDPPVALALLSKGRGRDMCVHVCVCTGTDAVFCVFLRQVLLHVVVFSSLYLPCPLCPLSSRP